MSDIKLIRGIKNGSENAINQAINKYSKLMWYIAGTVLKNVASGEDIEECVADVFVYLWENHDKFDEKRGSLKSWLSAVTKSKAIDKYRRLSKSSVVSLNEEQLIESIDVVDSIISAEQKREIISAINALGETDREIIIRRFYYQQKPKEIGFILDVPIKQIENRLYRAKLKLREMITKEIGGV